MNYLLMGFLSSLVLAQVSYAETKCEAGGVYLISRPSTFCPDGGICRKLPLGTSVTLVTFNTNSSGGVYGARILVTSPVAAHAVRDSEGAIVACQLAPAQVEMGRLGFDANGGGIYYILPLSCDD